MKNKVRFITKQGNNCPGVNFTDIYDLSEEEGNQLYVRIWNDHHLAKAMTMALNEENILQGGYVK